MFNKAKISLITVAATCARVIQYFLVVALRDAPPKAPRVAPPKAPKDAPLKAPGDALAKAPSSPPVKRILPEDLIGKPAPSLSIEKLLQAPAAAPSWQSLKGKCVVLEFWATWCAPCVASIPRMNELHEQFKDRPIEFIAVTQQTEDKIIPFLKRRPIDGWIGLDTNGSMFRDYGVRAIPHTVLVDAKGVIIAITDPPSVTKEVLESLLAGRPINWDAPHEVETVPSDPSEQETMNSLFQILIRPSKEAAGRAARVDGSLSLTGCPPQFIFHTVYDLPADQIDVQARLPEGTFDVIATMPNDREDQFDQVLRQAVELTFRVKARREKRDTDLYVLEKKDGESPRLTPSVMDSGSSTNVGPKRIELMNVPIAIIADALRSQLKKPVVDETGLSGRYDVVLEGRLDDVDSLTKTVQETLGLELRPATRPVEFLVIENETSRKGKKH
jgi:uncharacterized protein (TIGR03435 family)